MADSGHVLVSTGVDKHKGEYWYKCRDCGRSDWIASYGTTRDLDFINKPCKPPPPMPATHRPETTDWDNWKLSDDL